MFRTKSFQRRILLALLAVSLVPAALLLFMWTVGIQWIVSSVGTAGPWSSVAESGQLLLEAVASYLVSRQLSKGFSRPIRDLVGWTELIGRNVALPAKGPEDTQGVEEFSVLRDSLRTMARDLEEGRRQTIQAEKLRSWTEMARRVAHEIKNPLTPMGMAAENVSRLEGRTAQEAAAVLREEIGRLDEMARTFSQFGKMPEGPPSEVDLVELLRSLVDQHEGAGASLELLPTADLPRIHGHYDALLRSFRNLLLNAMDAAGSGGLVELRVFQKTDLLHIEIRDDGEGIPEGDLDQIWEPDFTTKSRGTGLGLPMVRQTIAIHNGTVDGRNHPDGGAVFSVELPVHGIP